VNPLNDDELNSLLRQAKTNPPNPSPELARRALRAYQGSVARPVGWRQIWLRPVTIPWPLAVLVALLLVLTGMVSGRRTAPPPDPSSRITTFTLKGMQPVRQFRPRIVRSIRDDQ
jgi:hypothetical protein